MSGSKLAISSVDNIVSFLQPSEQMYISSKYKQIAIKSSKEKIRKAVKKWINYYRGIMDVDYYHIPKLAYKRCYPLKYRQSFLEEVMDMLAPCDERYLEVCEYVWEESLVDSFNKTVDLLSEDELFVLGW